MFLEETNERTKKNIISFKIDNVYDVSIENKREGRGGWNANDSRWFEILILLLKKERKKMRR